MTTRANGQPLISVVNAGIVAHPGTGDDVIAFVSRGPAMRMQHLRLRPNITVAARRGWDWIAADGVAELAGPNDAHPDVADDAVPGLIRDIYMAAGGTPDDYDAFDREMVADERCAVLIVPSRVYGNNPTAPSRDSSPVEGPHRVVASVVFDLGQAMASSTGGT